MEKTLLTAAALAFAFGIKNNQKIRKGNFKSPGHLTVEEAIRAARKALEQAGK